ncbi:MAG: hypothetical protein M3R54_03110 [Chloroflexota bacterium]|nr:hypothetical protein [Chloroflexota bacterium]
MNAREIASAMARLGAESLAAHMLGDPVLTSRHGFAVARRAGLWCLASRHYDLELFNHVSGYGTFAPATQSGIDGLLRLYDRLDRVPRIEVLTPVVTRGDRALLLRNGFHDARRLFQCHVRTTSRPPRVRSAPGFSVTRVPRSKAMGYGKLASRGFGDRGGAIAQVFERGWARQLQRDARVAAFVGQLNGKDAATGVIIRRPQIAGLYSGSVLRPFRGRGLQNAMIAARVAHSWERGVRAFYSWTDPETSSARNLRDEGFRTRFELHIYERALR